MTINEISQVSLSHREPKAIWPGWLMMMFLLLGGCNRPPDLQWMSNQHSNRLVPVYLFGASSNSPGLQASDYMGVNSVYRSRESLNKLYGQVPEETLDSAADYMDNTDIFRLQMAAQAAGKRHIFLVIFDGLDWHSLRAAVRRKTGRNYNEGKGVGAVFQDYPANGTARFGFMVTSPYSTKVGTDVNRQTVNQARASARGGYSPTRAGTHPWSPLFDLNYLEQRSPPGLHAVTDSASSITAMMTGTKTRNELINCDPDGKPLTTVAQRLQADGWQIGAVSSVPISHATPAGSYAVNVSRFDYQDIARDLLGLPSISREVPLPGLDVLLGCYHEPEIAQDWLQGQNYVPGNRYLAASDLAKARHRYLVVERQSGQNGGRHLLETAQQARRSGSRLLGLFGEPHPKGSALPQPGISTSEALEANPTLAEMTHAALTVLQSDEDRPFWLLVEAGDVDFASHLNDFESLATAVKSGEEAVAVIFDWVEQHSSWDESLVIVTSDHGHCLVVR